MTQLNFNAHKLHLRLFQILLLGTAVAIPACTLMAQTTPTAPNDQTPPSAESQIPPDPAASSSVHASQEGFWGRVNPFARKKWVKKQLDPINDRLGELDEMNSKNARDIRDVDSRAQAGIRHAQSTAETANQTATLAGNQAQQANSTAQSANDHMDRLSGTVSNLDNYNLKSEFDLTFRGGQPVLNADTRSQLDDLATKLNGQSGYILEMEAHSPAAGSAGISHSQRLAEAVERYLVVKHEIPVYRMHAVALGNAQSPSSDGGDKPTHAQLVRTSSVHIRLMENSLAAQGAAATGSTTPASSTEHP